MSPTFPSKTRLLFVCMGNICRSPTAEGVMRKLIDEARLQHVVEVDSAGTHAYHLGHPPDERSQLFARQRGYELSALRARQVADSDYARFDLLLAMDWDNLHLLQAGCPAAHQYKLKRLMQFATRHTSTVVPDPYYGGDRGFEEVLDYVEDACAGLLAHVRAGLQAQGPMPRT